MSTTQNQRHRRPSGHPEIGEQKLTDSQRMLCAVGLTAALSAAAVGLGLSIISDWPLPLRSLLGAFIRGAPGVELPFGR